MSLAAATSRGVANEAPEYSFTHASAFAVVRLETETE